VGRVKGCDEATLARYDCRIDDVGQVGVTLGQRRHVQRQDRFGWLLAQGRDAITGLE